MSFEPVYNEHSRALILGTWPSPKSREMAFYYGHPQNRRSGRFHQGCSAE